MTKSFNSLPLLLLALVFAFASCNDEDAGDTTPPVITVISPADGAIIDIPGPVTVVGTIEEQGELERVAVTISSAVLPSPLTRTIMKGEDDFPTKTGSTYAINLVQQVDQDTPLPLSFDISLEAEDAAGNVGTKSLTVILR